MGGALIGLIGVITGVLLSNIASLMLERRRREVRIQDVAMAIRAEIRSHRQRLALFASTDVEEAATLMTREGYVPFVPRETPSFVMDAVVGEIILPTQAIDAVIYYYRQIAVLAQLVEDMQSEEFAALEPARKADVYRDYITLGAHALQLADRALADLEDSLVARPRASGS